ncbi:uncharacterized protein METZ01_LOCUS90485 [marine metagenome]|uniref:DUF3108 domain-containing protein n=1 Tax=marine metagenome TaxID=408172 RepID=A0A381VCA5_9ZZZZ
MINLRIIILLTITLFCFDIYSFPIPKNGEVKFDVIRKNKVIGSHEITFTENNDVLLVETNIDIEVKVLFISAYTFIHQSTETWINGNFTKIVAHSDFEDEREYFIKGQDNNDSFLASGMDGKLELDKNILPSNFWNIDVLKQKEIFDTQKGVVRTIDVEDLGYEKIKVNKKNIKCNKFILNASSNPKDKGPFPEYTLWYDENDELMKFQFKDEGRGKKIITIIRSN